MSYPRQGDEGSASVQTRKKKTYPPPDDVDYWMAKLEWPRLSLEAEKPAQFGPVDLDGTIGGVGGIREDLRKHAGSFIRLAVLCSTGCSIGLWGLMTGRGNCMTSFAFKVSF